MIWRLFKAILFLAVLSGLGLVAFAYVGPIFFPADFVAPAELRTAPITLQVVN
jgi:hypothetical protein